MQIDKSYAYEITGVVLVVGSAHHHTTLHDEFEFQACTPTKKKAAWP